MNFKDYESKAEAIDIATPQIDDYVNNLNISDYTKAKNLCELLQITYMILGLAGEAGELANKLKKIIQDNKGVISPENMLELAKENGDCTWYNARLFNKLKFTFEEGAQMNIDKLLKRADTNTLKGSGDNR